MGGHSLLNPPSFCLPSSLTLIPPRHVMDNLQKAGSDHLRGASSATHPLPLSVTLATKRSGVPSSIGRHDD